MAFKVFDKYGAASRQEVTVRASGYAFMSHGILGRMGKEHATHFRALYDEDTGRVALDFTNSPDNDGTWRELSKEKSGVSANIMPLLRFYNLNLGGKKRVLPVQIENDFLVMDIRTAIAKREDIKSLL